MPEPITVGLGNRILLQGAVAKIFNNVIIYHKNKIFISVSERIQVIGHFCFHHLSGSQDIKCPRSWKGLFSSHLPITIETTNYNHSKNGSNTTTTSWVPLRAGVNCHMCFTYMISPYSLTSSRMLVSFPSAPLWYRRLRLKTKELRNCITQLHHRCLWQNWLDIVFLGYPYSWYESWSLLTVMSVFRGSSNSKFTWKLPTLHSSSTLPLYTSKIPASYQYNHHSYVPLVRKY